MSYEPQFRISPRLLSRVESITRLHARIQGAVVAVPWIPVLQKDARMRNTHSSTAIEGNPLTLEEVRDIADGAYVASESERSHREIINYLAALRYVEGRPSQARITEQDILRLHEMIAAEVMNQGQAGSYRKARVRVGRYVPPPPHEVPGLMAEVLEWWNERSTELVPVLSSAIIHYRFEAIHPFADGNGRTGRVLALWELHQRGFDSHHIFSVDEYYWENRSRYYAALEAVDRAGGDLSDWLEYVAEGLEFTLERAWQRIQELSVASQSPRLFLRPRQEQLLRLLRERGAVPPAALRDALGISKQGLLDLLHPLISAGLVIREGTRKSGHYRLK